MGLTDAVHLTVLITDSMSKAIINADWTQRALKGGAALLQLTHKSSLGVMESRTGRYGNLIPDGNISTVGCFHVHHSGRSATNRSNSWMGSDKITTNLWKKIAGMSPAINADFFWHCIVTPARSHAGESDNWCDSEQVGPVKFQRVGGGGGYGANFSGDTQISWHLQRFAVYFGACHRLYRENVH